MAHLTVGESRVEATAVELSTRGKISPRQHVILPLSWRSVVRGLSVVIVLVGTARADEPGWLTGKAFQQILKEPLSVTWAQVDLRTVSRRLEENRRVALLVDRRLDPSATLDFRADDLPLDELVARLAQVRGGVVRVVGNTVYLGPEEPSTPLRTLVALRSRELNDAIREGTGKRGFVKPYDFQWTDLATPRELLERLAQRHSFELRGIERVPHDLWAAGNLPQSTLAEALSLILIQFDLTFAWRKGGAGVQIEPIAGEPRLEQSHATPKGTKPRAWLERIEQELPGRQPKLAGEAVVFAGLQEEHEAIEALRDQLRGTRLPTKKGKENPPGAKEVRYTLRMQDKPVGSLLKTLESRQPAYQFEYDAAALQQAGIRLEQRITLDVKEATLEELLRTALSQVRLGFEIDGQKVRLYPDPRAGRRGP
jgi:hypothetical protein